MLAFGLVTDKVLLLGLEGGGFGCGGFLCNFFVE